MASPVFGHFVHPELRGLAPDSEYFYRFCVGQHANPVGRTRTTPHSRSQPRNLKFAFASCQAWQDGYYTAYDHMAREDLDLVVHLGDYLYESSVKTNKRGVVTDPRLHTETVDLARYRLQYSLFKSEAPLQAAHAAFPWIHTMDDHEVDNNWAADSPQDMDPKQLNDTVEHFRQRRTNAFQAMYENLPLRRAQMRRLVRMCACTVASRTAASPTSRCSTPVSTARTSPAAMAAASTATIGSTPTRRCSVASRRTGCSRDSRPPKRAGRCWATRAR